MTKDLNRSQRLLYKVTNQAYLLSLGIVIVATLGLFLAWVTGSPLAQSEGLKLLVLYAIFGFISLIRWLIRYSKPPDGKA